METRTLETKTQNPQEEQAPNKFVTQFSTQALNVYKSKESVCKEINARLAECLREKKEWTKREIYEQDLDVPRARKRIQLIDEEITAFEKQKKAAEEQATEFANDFVLNLLYRKYKLIELVEEYCIHHKVDISNILHSRLFDG